MKETTFQIILISLIIFIVLYPSFKHEATRVIMCYQLKQDFMIILSNYHYDSLHEKVGKRVYHILTTQSP